MKLIAYFLPRWFCGSLILLVLPCQAEITLDGSLGGSAESLQGPAYEIQAGMGVQTGGNLFHSFGNFNLNANESATFNDVGASGPVENILSRVTGGRPSTINGHISTDFANSEPNLFFINPAGVVFGENASLDVQGSFHVSTSNYLKLGNEGVFHADLNEKTTLSVVPVTAFGFTDAPVGNISIDQSRLFVPEGETLSVIGGDIDYVGNGRDVNGNPDSFLFARGGRINLASVSSSGEVLPSQDNLDIANFSQLGDIQLSNAATISTNGDGGGRITVRGETLALDDTLISSSNLSGSTKNGRGIDISLTDALLLEKGAVIQSNVFENANGRSGDLTIDAQHVELSNGSVMRVETFGKGNAGRLTIRAEQIKVDDNAFIDVSTFNEGDGGELVIDGKQIVVLNGSQIGANTFGAGNGGILSITTDSLLLNGEGSSNFTGLTALSIGTGNAGNLTIKSGQIEVRNGTEISVNTLGQGAGGNLDITTDNLLLNGDGSLIFTGLTSQTKGTGNAGNLTIKAEQIEVRNAAQISVSTFNQGVGGNLDITTDKLLLNRDGSPSFTGLTAQTQSAGSAGSLIIKAGQIEVRNGAEISISTFSEGDGGDLTMNTESLLLDRDDSSEFTGLAAETQGTGNAGTLTVRTQQIDIYNGARISVNAFGEGNAGGIDLTANEITLASDARLGGIFAQSEKPNSGDAGNITIKGGNLDMIGSVQIGSSTFSNQGKGGTLNIDLTGDVTITDNPEDKHQTGLFSITNNLGQGGNLTLQTMGDIKLDGGRILTRTLGNADAGSLTIKSANLQIVNGGQIFSGIGNKGAPFPGFPEGQGKGGDINISVSETLLISGKDSREFNSGIYSSAQVGNGIAGNIKVSANTLEIKDAGQINVDTRQTDAGDIELSIGHILQLNNDSAISTSAAVVDDIGTGNGGNININSDDSQTTFTILDDSSQIIAQAQKGRGGEININTNALFRSPNSIIDASSQSGESGTVTIDSPDTNVIEGALILPGTFLDASALLSQNCAARSGKPSSSFIIKPLDGIQPAPDDYLSGFYTDRVAIGSDILQQKSVNNIFPDSASSDSPDTVSLGCAWY